MKRHRHTPERIIRMSRELERLWSEGKPIREVNAPSCGKAGRPTEGRAAAVREKGLRSRSVGARAALATRLYRRAAAEPYVESFNIPTRDELLDVEEFFRLAEAGGSRGDLEASCRSGN
jgi:hypothetical protein